MTQLTNLAPAASYGDLLTTTNQGQGLSNTLVQVQDGFGNPSPFSIALNAVDFNRSGGNQFKIGGIALIADIDRLNSLAGDTPVFSGTTGVVIPAGTRDQRPHPAILGTLRWNTDQGFPEIFNGIMWVKISTGNT